MLPYRERSICYTSGILARKGQARAPGTAYRLLFASRWGSVPLLARPGGSNFWQFSDFSSTLTRLSMEVRMATVTIKLTVGGFSTEVTGPTKYAEKKVEEFIARFLTSAKTSAIESKPAIDFADSSS
jgi:hypothetical protein